MYFFLWALILVVVDQVTKYIARSALELHTPVEVIPGFFNFTLVYNIGAAWGMLPGFRIGFVVLAVVMSFFIIRKRKQIFGESKPGLWAAPLLLSGIVGNAIDRVRFGYVTDFVDLWHGSYHFPCFNVADSCICVGVALYFIAALTDDRKDA